MANEIRRWMRCRTLMKPKHFNRTSTASVAQTVIPATFRRWPDHAAAQHMFCCSTEGLPAKYALTLLSHLKEIIFSTYKRDRSRITWTLYRVNVGRVLLLSQ